MGQHIYKGSGAPVTTPTGVGHHYIDETNDVSYISVGTSSSADWKSGSTQFAAISHTHPPSQITQGGATTGQVLKWNGSAWVPANESGGGGGGGDITDGGNITADTLVIGPISAEALELITSDITRLQITPDGDIAVGSSADGDTRFAVSEYSAGDEMRTALKSTLTLEDTADGAAPQMGIYVCVRANNNSGTYTLLRNYICAEMTGDSVVTEMYGARAIARTYDRDAGGGDTCAGTVVDSYGLEAYSNNTSTSGKVRRAVGILISSARATGSDSGHNHIARGMWIQNAVVASGGDVNEAFAIDSESTARSRFYGEILLENGKAILVKGTSGSAEFGFKAPNGVTTGYQLTLPTALPGTGESKVMTVDDAGNITLESAGGGSGDVTFGGNSNGAASTIGLNDNYDLSIKTNNVNRIHIESSGEVIIGATLADLGAQAVNFAGYKNDTVDSNKPFQVFENYYNYYGNSSNSRNGTVFSFSIRPGEPEFTYSGENVGLNASSYLGSSGIATSLVGFKNVISCLNGSGIIGAAIASIFNVTAPAGIIRNATGAQIQSVQAVGTDTGSHTAIGLDIATGGSGVQASGSSAGNTAIGLRIADNIVGTDSSIAIQSNSTAKSEFQGPMDMYKGVRIATTGSLPTASSALRGTQWVVQGGSGVADALYICLKDASDAYNWVQLS